MATLTAGHMEKVKYTREPMTAVFPRALQRMISAREQAAQAYVNQYLRTLDAKTLRELGWKEDEIAELINGASRKARAG